MPRYTFALSESLPPPRRREMLALMLGACIGTSLAACGSDAARPGPQITAYLPTWLTKTDYSRIQANLGAAANDIGRMHVSFATFRDGGATVGAPDVSSGLERFIRSLPERTGLSLTVGGANASRVTWLAAAANVRGFSLSLNAARLELEHRFSRPTNIDIDCERNIGSNNLTSIVHAVRDTMPANRQLSMAVPATQFPDTFDTRPGKLGDSVQTFHVMTYDEHGPWDKVAGPVATGPWVFSAIDTWVKKIGTASQVEVGYPAYGYVFPGAQEAGDTFKKEGATAIPFTGIPSSSIHDEPTLTSEAVIDDSWISCESPRVINRIAKELRTRHAGLGGSFFWSVNGLTSAHIDAVRR